MILVTKLKFETGQTDGNTFKYDYDYAGRFSSVSTEESGPPPDYNDVFASYKYNENSQVDSLQLNNFNVTTSYVFNNRNWITRSDNSNELFGYALEYYSNGNIDNQHLFGSYRTNFSDGKEINSKYIYDNSNRLEKIERNGNKYFELTGEYSYDPDGNFTSLTRSYNSDNFSYDYYSGTNRLKKVSGTTDQYTYDYNGNQTNDYINNNTSIKYDHRNLITEFTRQDLNQDPPITDITRYKYDEAGNRIRKTIYRSNDSNPPPLPEENEDLPTGWSITKDEYYSRDASGKEIAVYQSYALDYWNVWGTGNEGRIKPTGMKYFYLKDHLGSIRAVINQNNDLVEAQDYDPWGHIARTWDSTSANYKFTGKERDKESTYDYFGARYYDSRMGRWGGVESLLHKYFDITPYSYSLQNPLRFSDKDGKDVIIKSENTKQKEQIILALNKLTSQTGLKFTINDEGYLFVSGQAKDYTGELINKVIENKNVIVNLILVNSDFVSIEGIDMTVRVGLYNGSEIDADGKIQTSQYFNIPQAIAWEKADGSEVGISVLHEIKESFIGGVLFSGEPYGVRQYSVSHFLASATDPQNQFFPEMHREGPRGKIYFRNKNGEKIYIEY